MNLLQRLLQGLCLLLFVLVLLQTGLSMPGWLPAESMFFLDPLLFLGVLLALGIVIPALLVLGLLLAATLILGRFFCGYVCPLGSTFDFCNHLFARLHKKQFLQVSLGWLSFKYLLLLLIIASALLGLNLAHWGSPLAWAGRLYILAVLPWLQYLPQQILERLPEALHPSVLQAVFSQADPARYSTLLFLVPFFLFLFWLNHKSPRFWCRFICPAGALLALIGQRPLIRRRVSSACTNCQKCVQECPMQAISHEPTQTRYQECISCQKCVKICPERAVYFAAAPGSTAPEPFLPGRRQALQALGLGAAVSFLGHRGLFEYWPTKDKGQITPPDLVRPPGAVPETEFLNQCLRCGLCMQACPTNMLQPAWAQAGLSGVYSPLAVARRGPCEPECNACGQVCPSGAIRELSLQEKHWAKMGTAVINRRACIAWEMDRDCLICDEACPFGAVSLERIPGQEAAVPFVQDRKCTGCGFCEHACPVRAESAILVTPMAELRLQKGSYQKEGRRIGLDISREKEEAPLELPQEESGDSGEDQLPPGFSE
ncbi:MAG: 4Fe-4S binding protein [Desulfohalobiaceae bacterium]